MAGALAAELAGFLAGPGGEGAVPGLEGALRRGGWPLAAGLLGRAARAAGLGDGPGAAGAAGPLRDLCWEQLHTGHWSAVPDAWRDAHTLAACLVVVGEGLGLAGGGGGGRRAGGRPPKRARAGEPAPPPPADAVRGGEVLAWLHRSMRALDLAAIMGAPGTRGAAHRLASRVHGWLSAGAAPAGAAPAGAAPAGAGGAARPPRAGVRKRDSEHAQTPLKRTRDAGAPPAPPAPPAAAPAPPGPPGAGALPPGSLCGAGDRVPALERPSLESFWARCMGAPGGPRPAVLRGCMSHWPAMHRWRDLGYLARVAGHRTVPVELGDTYLSEGWTQRLMTLGEFLDRHVRGGQGGGAGGGTGLGAGWRAAAGGPSAARGRSASADGRPRRGGRGPGTDTGTDMSVDTGTDASADPRPARPGSAAVGARDGRGPARRARVSSEDTAPGTPGSAGTAGAVDVRMRAMAINAAVAMLPRRPGAPAGPGGSLGRGGGPGLGARGGSHGVLVGMAPRSRGASRGEEPARDAGEEWGAAEGTGADGGCDGTGAPGEGCDGTGAPGEGTGYLAQHPLFDQIPELRRDIARPDYCSLGRGEAGGTNAWFGPGGTVTPLHTDPDHNLLCQVVGRKYVRLYGPGCDEAMYPRRDSIHANASRVALEDPDPARFPLFAAAPYAECVLGPGEMLYVPPGHWHYVRSLSTSLSVNFFWR